MSTILKKTPLYASHVNLGGKMSPFAGFSMPTMYESVLKEHHYVRNEVGLFDVSHMGEIFIRGKDALDFLNLMITNDACKLQKGQSLYSALCNEEGGMVDDLIVYCLDENEYMLVVNASNIEKDYGWLLAKRKDFNVDICNESQKWAQIAVQGPKSMALLECGLNSKEKELLHKIKYTDFTELELFGQNLILARTGYTGEKGVELYCKSENALKVWESLLNQTIKAKPIGLGARDTLRLEASLLLYGQDMNENVSPMEADIAFTVKLKKSAFNGKEALAKQKEEGVERKLVCFKMEDPGIPRHGMSVFVDNKQVGLVTSGSVLPSIGGSGGFALLSSAVKSADKIFIDIRGKKACANVATKPLYPSRSRD